LRRWLVAGQIEVDWQSRFIIFGNEFIQKSPDAVRGFLRAHQRGVNDYIEGTKSGTPSAAFMPYLCSISMEKPELLANCAPGAFPADPRIDVAAVERDIKLITEAGLYPSEVPVSELIDLSFTPETALR